MIWIICISTRHNVQLSRRVTSSQYCEYRWTLKYNCCKLGSCLLLFYAFLSALIIYNHLNFCTYRKHLTCRIHYSDIFSSYSYDWQVWKAQNGMNDRLLTIESCSSTSFINAETCAREFWGFWIPSQTVNLPASLACRIGTTKLTSAV